MEGANAGQERVNKTSWGQMERGLKGKTENKILTCDNAASYGSSLRVTVDHGLHAVGVLHAGRQTGNVNTS